MLKIVSLLYLSLLLSVQGIKEYSEEFYECINPDKEVKSESECSSIKIPDVDGYKCCSMKIVFNETNSFSCFALENEFIKNKSILDEYIANRSLASLFGEKGIDMEINCDNIISNQKYEKKSEGYLNCYNSHINGINDENDCFKYSIPENERSKCCFLESQQRDDTGNIINDKRCYVIQDEYFTKDFSLNNYLLDKTNAKELDQIKNVNITIKCKNQEDFYFKGKLEEEEKINNNNNTDSIPLSDINQKTDNQNEPPEYTIPIKKKDSGISTGAVVGIVIASIVVLIGIAILTIYCIRKRKPKINEGDTVNEMKANQNNESDIIEEVNINNMKT